MSNSSVTLMKPFLPGLNIILYTFILFIHFDISNIFVHHYTLFVSPQQNLDQKGIKDLLDKLADENKHKYNWIKTRLRDTWQEWLDARSSLLAKTSLRGYQRKKVYNIKKLNY